MTRSSKKKTISPFLSKLHALLDDHDTDGIISWSSSGKSFIIWDVTRLEQELLPQYFQHGKFARFRRKLKHYGIARRSYNPLEFASIFFVQGQKDLNVKWSKHVNPFIRSCQQLVDDPSTDTIISWAPKGDAFFVWDVKMLDQEVLSKHFGYPNHRFGRFVKDLKHKGFTCCFDGSHWQFSRTDFVRSIVEGKVESSSNSESSSAAEEKAMNYEMFVVEEEENPEDKDQLKSHQSRANFYVTFYLIGGQRLESTLSWEMYSSPKKFFEAMTQIAGSDLHISYSTLKEGPVIPFPEDFDEWESFRPEVVHVWEN